MWLIKSRRGSIGPVYPVNGRGFFECYRVDWKKISEKKLSAVGPSRVFRKRKCFGVPLSDPRPAAVRPREVLVGEWFPR